MRARLLSTISVVGPVVGLALTLGACGNDSDNGFTKQPVADVEAQTLADMKGVTSLHLTGSISMTQGDVGLDMDISTSGDCQGSMTIKGGTAQILSVDGTAYLKGDEAFWTANAGSQAQALIQMLGDKWMKTGASEDQVGQLCDLDKFINGMGDDKGTDPALGEVATVEGVRAIEITSKKDGGTTHAWVAVDGKHYIVKLEMEGGDEPGTVTFSDFNKELELTAPADDEILDLSNQ
jgi:hypothetical protein